MTPETHYALRKLKSRVILGLMGLALLVCLLPLVSLIYTMLVHGAGALNLDFFTRLPAPVGEKGGVASAILGSLLLLLIATAVSVPLGLAKGLYLSQRGNTHLAEVSRLLLEAIAGIPAIVVGVFVYTIVVKPMHTFSMLAGGLALAMIMLPVFTRTTEEVLRLIPRSVNEAGLALGLPRYTVILRIVLRAAMPGVLTALFLALARVAGEAAPLLFTAFGDNHWPNSLLKPVGSLPVLIFNYAISPFAEWHRQAWGAALVLVGMILGVRLLTNWYTRRQYGRGGVA